MTNHNPEDEMCENCGFNHAEEARKLLAGEPSRLIAEWLQELTENSGLTEVHLYDGDSLEEIEAQLPEEIRDVVMGMLKADVDLGPEDDPANSVAMEFYEYDDDADLPPELAELGVTAEQTRVDHDIVKDLFARMTSLAQGLSGEEDQFALSDSDKLRGEALTTFFKTMYANAKAGTQLCVHVRPGKSWDLLAMADRLDYLDMMETEAGTRGTSEPREGEEE